MKLAPTRLRNTFGKDFKRMDFTIDVSVFTFRQDSISNVECKYCVHGRISTLVSRKRTLSLNRELERQDISVNKRQVIGSVGRLHAARESPY